MNSSYIDSHAHLSDLDLAELQTASNLCKAVLNVGVDIASSQKVCDQSEIEGATLLSAVGVAIPEITKTSQEWREELESLVTHPSIVAIGETGLDRANDSYPPIELQREFFLYHIELAKKYDLPLVLHSRGAEEEVLNLCQEYGVTKAVFHCYTGPSYLIPLIEGAGYYISLSGIVTFKNGGLEEVAQTISQERLLLETDSPYLAPVPVRGTQNCPNNMKYIVTKVAEVRGVSHEALLISCQKNFEMLFSVSLN